MKEKQKTYKAKNKQFAAWLPHDLHSWFVNYLKVKSVGSSTGERFRQFLYSLQKQAGAELTKLTDQRSLFQNGFV